MGIFDKIAGKNEAIDFSYDLDFIKEASDRAYLKRWSIDTCVNHIARTMSQTKFTVEDEVNQKDYRTVEYKLNVRPNTDESAATFWQKLTRKLILDNEVLVIKTDTDDLVIADDWEREEWSLYDDIFKNIVVGDYKLERNYLMKEVIYLVFSNSTLTSYLNGLFRDYGQIFGRMIKMNLMSNQIRATLSMDSNQANNEANKKAMQNFIHKTYEAFEKNDIAIAPVQKGFEYKEHSSGASGNKGQSLIEDLGKVPEQLLKFVARTLGIPVGLILGETADVEAMTQNYMKFCVNPLIEKVTDELNAKLLSEKESKSGVYIQASSIDEYNPIEKSEAIDKLVASGAFTRNEVRKMTGYGQVDDPEMDEFILTKNYQTQKDVENEEDYKIKLG
ncbi:phage portal protein [Staphylococcus auricularis]|uniref:phage portal protein n=1 Tax=Staphylococcus auricularis TaxID=29379 RepID=UPI001933D8F6|nr:phage portal protein [Staphylococcus auricularis]MBM0868855.1 phage portal protein [Staphylococcus auricularis]